VLLMVRSWRRPNWCWCANITGTISARSDGRRRRITIALRSCSINNSIGTGIAISVTVLAIWHWAVLCVSWISSSSKHFVNIVSRRNYVIVFVALIRKVIDVKAGKMCSIAIIPGLLVINICMIA